MLESWITGLTHIDGSETRSICAENPTGAISGGAQAEPGQDAHCTAAARRLGKGWKVRPCLRNVEPGQTVVLADVDGPGAVQHVWCTVQPEHLRTLALSVTYDDQKRPAILTPLGDFFANGIDGLARIVSLPIAVNPRAGMNSYWPMPFRRKLRIELTNDGHETVPEFFYQITYALRDVADDEAYLYASWRRTECCRRDRPEHIIIDNVSGLGHYVGTYLVWNQLSNGWWGEGEVKFFIDDDPDDAPTICGTGTEDYFGGAWGFCGDDPQAGARPETFSGPFLGYAQALVQPSRAGEACVPAHGLYRWHIPDPICFKKNLRVTVQALGWWPDGTYQPRADDISSLALWYQLPPASPLADLPPVESRYTP